jgi:benzoyl-CoA reductase subunit A
MITVAGVDLGSTTTKAVLLDESGKIIGQGITNSRSNYEVACAIALEEARLGAALSRMGAGKPKETDEAFRAALRLTLHRRQLRALREEILAILGRTEQAAHRAALAPAAEHVLEKLEEGALPLFRAGAPRRSDFFRDLAGEQFLATAERLAAEKGVQFERLAGLYDRGVMAVETHTSVYEPASLLRDAFSALREVAAPGTKLPDADGWKALAAEAVAAAAIPAACVGTGYGRQTLPFDVKAIRSEILCHGRGAHFFFPGTRTVLDIGGQDTKAIQVDRGVVTGFQMNDRCAAGCGRYLGYIADELSLGLHELGPLALQARRKVRVNSTCTVFAGAELRERLSLGERREDILWGLHRAIVLRALSLLSRAGGVQSEFTFTGGVCKNPAVTKILDELVRESYGKDLVMNVHSDSIFFGAIGAALFALDDVREGRDPIPPRFLSARPVAPAPIKAAAPAAVDCGSSPASAFKVLQGGPAGSPAAPAPSAVQIHLPQARAEAFFTAGVDVGASAVKAAVVRSDGVEGEVLAIAVQRIRRRLVKEVAQAAFREACERAGIDPAQMKYVASTGDGDAAPFRTGHFYSMTAHARGAQVLIPGARGALDMGALHARAIRMDANARVLGHRMTSQCASGTGQFLENVARYLGVPLEDVGALSLQATAPEVVSSVCAVLSETDVINLVSRGIPAPDILQGIHIAIAGRLARLVGSAHIEGILALTGGLALDAGLVEALRGELATGKSKTPPPELRAAPDAVQAGAIGAAFLGALRYRQLAERGALAQAG